jgi:hypothetical protein
MLRRDPKFMHKMGWAGSMAWWVNFNFKLYLAEKQLKKMDEYIHI